MLYRSRISYRAVRRMCIWLMIQCMPATQLRDEENMQRYQQMKITISALFTSPLSQTPVKSVQSTVVLPGKACLIIDKPQASLANHTSVHPCVFHLRLPFFLFSCRAPLTYALTTTNNQFNRCELRIATFRRAPGRLAHLREHSLPSFFSTNHTRQQPAPHRLSRQPTESPSRWVRYQFESLHMQVGTREGFWTHAGLGWKKSRADRCFLSPGGSHSSGNDGEA